MRQVGLLAACGVMRLLKQPAARQRVGEWAVLAALLVAVLRLGPTWLPLPQKGSNTTSPGLVCLRIGRVKISTGFCVGWSLPTTRA